MEPKCKKCSLHSSCRNPLIFGKGSHPKKTEIMIIQDAPTFFEDRCGDSPVGDVKAKINYFLEKAKIDYKKVYFTSAVKCAPKKLSDIKKKNIDACRDYLLSEIIEHKPKVIILMGKVAHEMITLKSSVAEFAGHFTDFSFDYEVETGTKTITNKFECKIIPTYSLVNSIKGWQVNGDIIRHFKKAKQYAEEDIIDRTPDPEVNLILNIDQLNEWVDRMKKFKGVVATDFETTGFEFFKDKIINIGYCSEVGKADVIYLSKYKKEHVAKWSKKDLILAKKINEFLTNHNREIWSAVKEVNNLSNIKFCLHNGKFDQKFAIYNKIKFKNFYFDTLVADSLIDENVSHSLNFCLERRNINYGAYDTELWPYVNKDENKKKSYQYVPPSLLVKYLGFDVDGDKRLYEVQKEELVKEEMEDLFYNVKMPSLKEIIEMEYRGVLMDKDLIIKTASSIQNKQNEIQEQIEKVTGIKGFNPNSPKQIIDYMTTAGFPFAKLKIAQTKTGFSTSTEELQKFVKYKKWSEFPTLLINSKKIAKIRGTYVDGKNGEGGMLKYLDENDCVHANFNIWTAVTGRQSCFAKGTLIEVVRDLRKYPKGVPIEEVKIGDLAYTYTNEGKLTLRRVLSKFNNGKKEIVRMHWVSSSGRPGFIDVTEDHKVKTYDRGFVAINKLNHGEKLYYLSRKAFTEKGYATLMYKDYPSGEAEHRIVFKNIKGELKIGYDIHHIDNDHWNNHPDNLEEMTKEDHRSLHAKDWSNREHKKRLSSEVLKHRWDAGKVELPKGENHSCYKGWSKLKLLKIIMKAGGRIKYTGYDYYTIMKYIELHNIDHRKLFDRFTHTGRFLKSCEIRECLSGSFENAKKKLEIGQTKWQRLRNDFSFETNHKFVCIERLNKFVDVYDLEIEDTHNYIAGEICAHNCNRPSLQVWPRPIKGLPNTRNFVIPSNDWKLFSADYSALEMYVVAGLSKDISLINKLKSGLDIHSANAVELGKILGIVDKSVNYEQFLDNIGKGKLKVEEIEKETYEKFNELRTKAKSIAFGLNYGKGAKSFAEEFKISEDEAQDMIDAYFEIYKGLKKWRDGMVNQALTKGYVKLLSGRKRRFNMLLDWLNSEYSEGIWSTDMLREEISRQAMNFPVQGGAHEVFEPAYLRLIKRFKQENMQARLLLLIHDDIVGEAPESELKMVSKCIVEEMPTILNEGTKYELKLVIEPDFYSSCWYSEKVKIS